nr:BPK_HP1_G0058300.mRNA.1.CDS.1 [Saccharomyces cerevisiae]
MPGITSKDNNLKRSKSLLNLLKFIARNMNLTPTKLRLEAQLKIGAWTLDMQICSKVILGCVGINLRENALKGNLPGVKKGIW